MSLFFADAYCLDIKWSESDGIKSFQALEMKVESIQIKIEGKHYFPSRYLHAEFDLAANCFDTLTARFSFSQKKNISRGEIPTST